ncbi:MAG: hypothetical protein J6P61_01010 [Erysipelotrichaceae bacterium]|nr:hypothetical protein [Erysipelotrichaceae bacterium]
MRQEFKVKPNLAVGIFLTALTGVMIFYIAEYFAGIVTLGYVLVDVVFMIFMYLYFLGCRPYVYIVENKKIISKNRLFGDKTVDLMRCEVITDAVSRLADLVTRPHAIEIYDEAKKRHKYFPADPVGFTGAVVASNKRIHCTVAAYTDVHRSIEKRQRRERRRQQRADYNNTETANNGSSRKRRR